MPDSVGCACSFSDDKGWHCKWVTVDARGQADKEVVFSVTPAQFVQITEHLERLLTDRSTSPPRPELDSSSLRCRYRRNAELYELRLQAEANGLHAMVDPAQLTQVLDYHKKCLQEYAIAVYEGRTPIPQGYPAGYPDPHW